jgi:hypothetical protein
MSAIGRDDAGAGLRRTDIKIVRERMMKLAAAMVAQTLDQYDAKVLPETHPAVSQLSQRFGDHTFFIDGSGLNIIEPTHDNEPEQTMGVVVNIASWGDAERSTLEPHTPEMTDIVVDLGTAKSPGSSAHKLA